MQIDWDGEIGGTRELLACVPGVTEAAFKIWRVRGVVRLSAADIGTGHRAVYRASDALQVAMAAELSGQTALIHKAPFVWLLVRRAMLRRQGPYIEGSVGEAVLLTIGPDGQLQDWSFRESDLSGLARGLAAPGAPATAVLLRIDHLIDDVAARIAALQPVPV